MTTTRRKRTTIVEAGVNGREPSGRFAPGNRCSSGRRRNRDAIARAFRDAVSEGDLRDLARRLVKQAKGGSVVAAREVLDRVIGKPIPAREGEPLSLALPPCSTPAECRDAFGLIFGALTEGTIDVEEARVLGDVVNSARAAIETMELQRRLDELEDRLR